MAFDQSTLLIDLTEATQGKTVYFRLQVQEREDIALRMSEALGAQNSTPPTPEKKKNTAQGMVSVYGEKMKINAKFQVYVLYCMPKLI